MQCVYIKCVMVHIFLSTEEEKWTVMFCITNTFKEILELTDLCFRLAGETFPASVAVLVFNVAHADSLLSLCLPPHRSVQTLADKSKQEALKVDLMEALKRKHNS